MEQRQNSGILKKNDDRKSESHPHYRGEINIEGRNFWLSAWVKTGQGGNKFLSLAVKPREPRQEGQQPSRPRAMDDPDIPW